jgi:HD-GYP domain-containing protein (c-di-GMP phosphodiesterase class II)
MTGLRRRRRVAPVLAIAGLAALPAVIALSATAGRMVMVPPGAHLVVVGTTGALAAAAAICMSVLAARLHDGRAVLLGLAFSVMATMLLFHSLATPGVLIGDNGLVQFAGALNIPAGAGILAASALPVLRRPAQMRVLLRVQAAVVAAMVLLGVTVLLIPALVPVIPHPGSGLSDVIFAISAAGLWLLIWRAARTYLLTRRVSDLLVTVGVVWLVGAQYGLLHYGMMDGAFWAAHVLEVSGIGLVGLPAALDLRHGVASRPLVGDLRAADLVDHEEAFLGARVRALMVRLATKDPSTEGHTRRVATLAVQLGEQLGVPESRLRLLALGGLLHDMGKLSVPDHILTKPGKLDDDEFAVIRRHPAWGRELLAELGGFPPLVLDLVESHHERLDGAGYPRGALAGTLPLEVRILTVADVYDALTADRVYREAWSPERAFGVLDADTGSAFDPACVAALRALLPMPRGAAAGAPARQGARRVTGTVLAPGA